MRLSPTVQSTQRLTAATVLVIGESMANGPAHLAGTETVNVSDHTRLARARLPEPVWDYLAAGAGAESTTRADTAALRRSS